jgi:hypothetical protein
MTWQYLGNGIYTCKSSDTKVTTGVTTDAVLFEIDTNLQYQLTGGAWVVKTIAMGNLSNVNLTGLGNGMALKWDTATSKWIVYTPGSGGSGGDVFLANTQTFTGVNTFDQRLIVKALASTPTSPASGYTTVYAKTKDVNNEGIFAKIKVAGTVSEVELGVADEVLTLNELADVAVTTPADKHVMIYDNASTLFVNRLLATADLPTINATTNTITDTSSATGDILKHNGTKFVRLARGTANQVLTTNSGATDIAWAAPTGGSGGGDVYLANANVFTAVQKINVDNGTQMTFYRPVNTLNFGAGFSYDFNNAAGTEVNYGQQYVAIEANTTSAHRGDFYVQLAVAASLGIRFRIYTSGNGGIIFGNNQRIQIDETGLTAARIYTLPDAAGEINVSSAAQTQTNKTIVAASNTITDTSAATGDILRHNGTKFVRLARGTANQALRTNSGGTDIAWATLNSENAGTALASGNGSTTTFNVAHGLGSTPYMAHIQCSTHTNTFTYTYDATNITVVFGTAPATGTNNVKFQWRAIL